MTAPINHLLLHCGSLKEGETLTIICDPDTQALAQRFLDQAATITNKASLHTIPLMDKHGLEPAAEVTEKMIKSDLIMSLCTFSLAHSQARINAGKNGARFLSMPLYTDELLNDPAILFDYKSQEPLVRSITQALTNGNQAHIHTKAGTDITLDISGRVGNCCPGFVKNPGDLGSPPDIEANISPVEHASQGRVVIDGSITCPEIGLLSKPIELTVDKGHIIKFDSENQTYIDILDEMFGELTSKKRILAECGIGLNPDARLTGTMLTDEGAMGCLHFGFGSNYTVGGQNKIGFHLDFVFRNGSISVDNQDLLIDGDVVL